MIYKWYAVVYPDGSVFMMTATTLNNLKRRLYPNVNLRIIPVPVKGLQKAWWWLSENYGLERTGRPLPAAKSGITYENLPEGHFLLRREGPLWKRRWPATTGRPHGAALKGRAPLTKKEARRRLQPKRYVRTPPSEQITEDLKPPPRPLKYHPRPRTPPMEEIIR